MRPLLQSGLLRRFLFPALCLWLCAGCSSLPESFAPPPQRPPLEVPPGLPVGYFVYMGDPESDRYIVQGFASMSEGAWRWAYEHPVLRFWGPDMEPVHFFMDFAIPERTFRETGPVTLTVSLNGQVFDHLRCAQAGQQSYSHEAPAALLLKNAMNLVSIQPDKFWVSREDGTKLGFILVRAGFSE
jgi:hypothetical protein